MTWLSQPEIVIFKRSGKFSGAWGTLGYASPSICLCTLYHLRYLASPITFSFRYHNITRTCMLALLFRGFTNGTFAAEAPSIYNICTLHRMDRTFCLRRTRWSISPQRPVHLSLTCGWDGPFSKRQYQQLEPCFHHCDLFNVNCISKLAVLKKVLITPYELWI